MSSFVLLSVIKSSFRRLNKSVFIYKRKSSLHGCNQWQVEFQKYALLNNTLSELIS